MKILVCISNVPDTTTKVSFTNNNTELNPAGVQYILNPYDEIALARAIEIAEARTGTVSVIHVGEINSEPTIRKALAIGADDAIRVNAPAHDSYFVAKQIAHVAMQENYDLILTGRESSDFNGSQVPAMVGELLNIPSVSIVKKITMEGSSATLEREIEGGKEIIVANLPLIASASEGMAEPKIPNMRGIMSARSKPLNVVEAIEVSKLISINVYEMPKLRSQVNLINASEASKLIDLLHSEAKVI